MRNLVTARLRLEPVTALNADVLWHLLQAAELREFQDLPDMRLPSFIESVGRRPLHLASGQHGRYEWLLYPNEGRECAGWISLRIPEREPGGAEVGYSILARFRRLGYATEAVSALLDEGFAHVRLQRICAYCVPENLASVALLERLGFTRDITLPRGATVRGEPVDIVSYYLESCDWRTGLRRTLTSTDANEK